MGSQKLMINVKVVVIFKAVIIVNPNRNNFSPI
jgi:hypothetical protein